MNTEAKLHDVSSSIEINRTAAIAKQIWNEHYTPIIGIDQVNYMIDKFQSVNAITEQVESGYLYFLLSEKGIDCGYLAVKKETDCVLFLSKIYVSKKKRGLGLGKLLLNKAIEVGKNFHVNQIRLTVNKNNTSSINAYEKMGFVKSQELVQEIGNGFVMDDYEYVLTL